MSRDRCPECGQPRGYTMETDGDLPGAMGILAGKSGPVVRWVLTAGLTVLAALLLFTARILLHISV